MDVSWSEIFIHCDEFIHQPGNNLSGPIQISNFKTKTTASRHKSASDKYKSWEDVYSKNKSNIVTGHSPHSGSSPHSNSGRPTSAALHQIRQQRNAIAKDDDNLLSMRLNKANFGSPNKVNNHANGPQQNVARLGSMSTQLPGSTTTVNGHTYRKNTSITRRSFENTGSGLRINNGPAQKTKGTKGSSSPGKDRKNSLPTSSRGGSARNSRTLDKKRATSTGSNSDLVASARSNVDALKNLSAASGSRIRQNNRSASQNANNVNSVSQSERLDQSMTSTTRGMSFRDRLQQQRQQFSTTQNQNFHRETFNTNSSNGRGDLNNTMGGPGNNRMTPSQRWIQENGGRSSSTNGPRSSGNIINAASNYSAANNRQNLIDPHNRVSGVGSSGANNRGFMYANSGDSNSEMSTEFRPGSKGSKVSTSDASLEAAQGVHGINANNSPSNNSKHSKEESLKSASGLAANGNKNSGLFAIENEDGFKQGGNSSSAAASLKPGGRNNSLKGAWSRFTKR